MRPNRGIARQRGATLLVVLVMLVVLTLFAVSVINLSNLNAKAVGNMQFREAAEGVAQNAIEQVLSNSANFYSPNAVPVIASNTTQGMTVTVSNRICLASDAATGYSLAQQIIPEDDYWEFQVTVTDPVSSASVVAHQGAKIRMLANNCPN
jgi:Tfp pilus assembly protein PilX